MSERVRELEMEQIRFDRLFDRILRDPTNQQLRVEAGEILFRNGQEKEALSMLQSVVRAAPRHREANRALADYYRRIGDTSRAEFHQRQVQ